MIRNIFQTLSLLLLTFLFACGGGSNSNLTSGQELRSEADGLYQQQMFSAADQKYREALTVLEVEGNADDILACRDALERILYITSTYPLSAEEMKAQLDQAYPDVPEAQRQEWMQPGEFEQMEWDGKTHYFEGALENLAYRYPTLMHANAEKNEKYFQLVNYISDHFIDNQYPEGQPYGNPNSYIGTGRLNVPRAELPESGLLKLWLPLAVTLDAQTEVAVLSITPETYVREPASLHADISLAYLEVPLDELKSDLSITVKFRFTHYTTRYQVGVPPFFWTAN